MSSVRIKWKAVFGLSLLFALVAGVSPTTPSGSPHQAQAQGEVIIVDYSSVVSQAPSGYGTNIWWSDQDATLWTDRWEELGVTLVRVPVLHALVEPVNDNDDPIVANLDGFLLETPIGLSEATTQTITYKAWFEALRDRSSAQVMISFLYLAPWLTDNPPHQDLFLPAAPYPPNDLIEYREFVEVLLRYLVDDLSFPSGRLLVETMNEPDLRCGQDPVVPCFWQNWTMQDVADVVRVTYRAAKEVNANIRVVGLAECCGTEVVRTLLDHYPEGTYLEGLSYHYYSPSGYNLSEVLGRATALAPYGLPLYLDEYGSIQYRSEGMDGALWHSWALPILWKAGLSPLQFSISELPFVPEPYNNMGLFRDRADGWEYKPAFWVYANFFRHMGHRDVISSTILPDLHVMAGREIAGGEARFTIWITNWENTDRDNVTIQVHSFPKTTAVLNTYDNLGGRDPVEMRSLSGSPLTFTVDVPARSSRSFTLNAPWLTKKMYLPSVLKEASP